MHSNHETYADLIWSVADLLRGHYRQPEYGKIILPFIVLRRLDCALAPTKAAVLAKAVELKDSHLSDDIKDRMLRTVSGTSFYNTSELDFGKLLSDSDHLATNLRSYVGAFSPDLAKVLEKYRFDEQIARLDEVGLLYVVTAKFAQIDLHPDVVDNQQMGYVFEELIRKFSEISNETTGEHFTPREVIRLMVNLLMSPDDPDLMTPGIIREVYDPACGTGGMLSASEEYIKGYNAKATVKVSGQELNPESWAICRSDMLLRGQDPSKIAFGNSFTQDGHLGETFDYLMANPPFGVEWKKVQTQIMDEANNLGWAGRFGAGTPRINDGSFLFLQHMISKMKPVEQGGSRIAIIFNGSPLFTGAAGSGESEIRRWILENDWLEAIVALPDQLFYNTGIPTYFWILSNRKVPVLKDKVVLLNAREHWTKMRKSLGDKRKLITDDQIAEVTSIYKDALAIAADEGHEHHAKVKVFPRHVFGYQRITVERPLRWRFEVTEETASAVATAKVVANFEQRDVLLATLRSLAGTACGTKLEFVKRLDAALAEQNLSKLPAPVERAIWVEVAVSDPAGQLQTDRKDNPLPDPDLRNNENIPLTSMHSTPDQLEVEIEEYMKQAVLPYFPEAWVDNSKTKIGYEIPPMLFLATRWKDPFEPLGKVVRQVTPRSVTRKAELQLPILRIGDLQLVDFASELSEFPALGELLTPCSGGEIVGRPGNWRLLPDGFGSALTPLKVLRPLRHSGRVLCEWLNSAKINEYVREPWLPTTVPVPITAIMDQELNRLTEDLHDGRRSLRRTTSRILPNIFNEFINDTEGIRRATKSLASEAHLIDELVRPIEDPLWRAEWSYPYHIAALARQYRIAATPDVQRDGVLKLGEGVARILGIVALALEIRRRGSFSSKLRSYFRIGASFGTWLKIVKQLVEADAVPEFPELSSTLNPGGAYEMLHQIQNFRNVSHHAHGVPSHYQIKNEVAQLEPILMASLESVSWLSGIRWELVDQCHFLGNGNNQLIGELLRGSHPDWEPFSRLSIEQLTPNRIYVRSPSSSDPIDLWPIASGEFCTECDKRELFLLDKVTQNGLVLRSLKGHLIDRDFRW
ncbi:type I restriction-modification system subunit M [Streptosporangium vulgare]|uniref:site-specific DNA-methyltransferase (adenine-specific) n=1 Tax=Streptosporangium vulgare TaxID=46190 RepID=A0ABV5TE18_9ACTN